MDQPEPVVVNASGDYIRNLQLGDRRPPASPVPIYQGSTDRMADFFHTLMGVEGTLRNWNNDTSAGKIQKLEVFEKPVKTNNITEEDYKRLHKAWHAYQCGVIFMEALAQTPDRLVAQAAFDNLFPGKIGKR